VPLAAKAVGALAHTRGPCKDYLRVNYKEKPLGEDRLPVLAVSTTAR
jgi:alcohol dehydrogenase class IV